MSETPIDVKGRIEEANAEGLPRRVAGEPMLVDVAPAGEVVTVLEGRMVLDSGPPVTWDQMSGAQRGSVIGIVRYEGPSC